MTGKCPYGEERAAYVLGALADDEREAFEQHLTGCLLCRRDVRELRTAAALLHAAPQHDPRPELKDRIMAVVESEAEVLRAAGPEADIAPARRSWRPRTPWPWRRRSRCSPGPSR